jgi:hypothetical protein
VWPVLELDVRRGPAVGTSCKPGTAHCRAATSVNKRVPPALTTFAAGNTARVASRVGTLERYAKWCGSGVGTVWWTHSIIAAVCTERHIA